ncbi:hypothetical protein Bbelb_209200 [Branchiostoma belcheri]|nr:hypothetical protein Bbelb_209200 [Branchiostoma belcheri]
MSTLFDPLTTGRTLSDSCDGFFNVLEVWLSSNMRPPALRTIRENVPNRSRVECQLLTAVFLCWVGALTTGQDYDHNAKYEVVLCAITTSQRLSRLPWDREHDRDCEPLFVMHGGVQTYRTATSELKAQLSQVVSSDLTCWMALLTSSSAAMKTGSSRALAEALTARVAPGRVIRTAGDFGSRGGWKELTAGVDGRFVHGWLVVFGKQDVHRWVHPDTPRSASNGFASTEDDTRPSRNSPSIKGPELNHMETRGSRRVRCELESDDLTRAGPAVVELLVSLQCLSRGRVTLTGVREAWCPLVSTRLTRNRRCQTSRKYAIPGFHVTPC